MRFRLSTIGDLLGLTLLTKLGDWYVEGEWVVR
jgi:hypothetical protein